MIKTDKNVHKTFWFTVPSCLKKCRSERKFFFFYCLALWCDSTLLSWFSRSEQKFDIPKDLNPDTWVTAPSSVGNDETWVCSACTRKRQVQCLNKLEIVHVKNNPN